ncbi:MAG: protease modulator HflC [Gammaproteobacteria bacterium]|jgi:membrane protease subunit HflC|nr:protease modulator HflC [Gammaproteobacteria bacterium]
MQTRLYGLLTLVAVVLLSLSMSVFVVHEREQAIKFRFGEIIKADFEPGLHFKVPFINNVIKFSDQILTLDNRPERFLTGERKFVLVDFFVKWRISDVTGFYIATAGDELMASQRLFAIITDSLRKEFAKRTIQEVVAGERAELMDEMMARARKVAAELGITIVDIRVKRIDLPDEVSGSVFERMRQERVRIAKQFRAEGAEMSVKIRAEADRQRTIMLAEAFRDAQSTRGEGDAIAAGIYSKAYLKNPEFYSFYRSLQAYRQSLGLEQDLLVLKPDSEFFRYLKSADGN